MQDEVEQDRLLELEAKIRGLRQNVESITSRLSGRNLIVGGTQMSKQDYLAWRATLIDNLVIKRAEMREAKAELRGIQGLNYLKNLALAEAEKEARKNSAEDICFNLWQQCKLAHEEKRFIFTQDDSTMMDKVQQFFDH